MLNRGGIFRLTAGDIPLDRGGLFKFGNFENRKGAAKPRPLCTPLGLFLSSARDSLFLFVDLCLYASVFSALRCADVVLFLHFLCGSLSARCLYSSILSALCVAISRFESQPASPRRPFTNRSTTATTTSQPSSAAPMAQNLPSSLPTSHNQTTNQAATLSHNITTFTPSDTTPKHPPYKPQAAHKPPAAAQPGSWNSRPYKPRSTPYSAPYQ